MNVSPNIFREYDIRGEADTELTNETVTAIGKSFGTWLLDNGVKKIAIGGDVRLSTERIRAAVIAGITSVGIDVTDIGVVTTPMLYWSLYHLDLNGAIMVTGSHNPAEMNGLKLVFNKATIWGNDIQEIRKIIEKKAFFQTLKTGIVDHKNITDNYINMLTSKFKLDLSTQKTEYNKLKVVCDSGNGTAGAAIARFITNLGCECISLFEAPDGRFPNHHPDPQKRENLAALVAKIKETGADVGFGFDGDADRIGVVDEQGEVIFGDRLMALYWTEILAKHPGAEVIVEPKCSMALPDAIEQMGGKVVWWKSGHSVIKAKMKDINAIFAGEFSGHMFFADEYYGFDDSFYAAARLLRILCNTGKKLSELMKSIPIYPITEEARISCPDSKKFAFVEQIRDKALKEYSGLALDGVRILYPDGWGLIRASNTQPVITTRCEGRDQKALQNIMQDIKKRILAEGLPDFEWTF